MKKHLTRDACPNCGHGAILQQGVDDSDGVRTIAIMWFCERCGTVKVDQISGKPYCEPLDPDDDGDSVVTNRTPASWWREPVFIASLVTLAAFTAALWFFFGADGLFGFLAGVLVMTALNVMNLRNLVRAGNPYHNGEELP